eukprot:CAMPEP_0184299412 /NCGR_PEP_ID=MMETSP1049-20130417/10038_1 /TAXON_ID=77928 /ORGANISM="Proteomonas sulcata, Strain CCMP704" /LENGTH=497 /DNA_ID=CAMNT_0026609845 /DNA_START=132 /DNA_END=1625 /DNA_ORIENTATION=+
MAGSDIVYYEAASNTITDSHAKGESAPIKDTCQDWTLVSGGVESGKIFFEAKRTLATGDPEDRAIISDHPFPKNLHRVIGAWGDGTTIGYHSGNRLKGGIRFFTDGSTEKLDTVISDTSLQNTDLLAPSYTVPSHRTTYYRQCYDLQDLIGDSTERHVVAMTPVIAEASNPYVHHLTISACPNGCGTPLSGREGVYEGTECNGVENMIWAWAPGHDGIVYPDEAGLRILTATYRYMLLEIHYDNPGATTGFSDSSGLKLHHTTTLRPNDIGLLVIGDPTIDIPINFIREGVSKISFDCKGLMATMTDQEINIVQRGLHMHDAGAKMEVRVERNGQTVDTTKVDYWDFKAAGVHSPITANNGFKPQKGDDFYIDCYFKTSSTGLSFGVGSNDEMCMEFISYWPKQNFQQVADWIPRESCVLAQACDSCDPTPFGNYLDNVGLSGDQDLGRAFDQTGDCRGGVVGTTTTPEPSTVVSLAPKFLLTAILLALGAARFNLT